MVKFQVLKKWFFKHPQTAGVTIVFKAESISYHLIVLGNKKDEIQIVSQMTDVETLDHLLIQIPRGIPIHLTLHGRGILHKQSLAGTEQQGVQAVLPNANPAQFYVQEMPAAQGSIFSIIRKQVLEKVLSDFKNKGFWINGLTLGPFGIDLLWPYLSKPDTLQSLEYDLQFDANDGRIKHFAANTIATHTTLKIGDETLAINLLPAYSGALKIILGIPSDVTTTELNLLQEEYQQKQLFDRGWKIALGTIGIILLLNTLSFYYFKKKNNQLIGASSFALSQIKELDTLKANIERQEQLVQLTSINQSTDLSYYADHIGQTLLKGLKLRTLDIFPMEGKAKDYDKKSLVHYDRQSIRVKGQCGNSLTYNKWINKLEALDWVQKVKHLDYKDLSSNLAEFEMVIMVMGVK